MSCTPSDYLVETTSKIERTGSVTRLGVSVVARDLSAAVRLKKSQECKIILDKVNVCIKKGRVNAILGPSGSGKTSLLNVLSGRIRTPLQSPNTNLRDPQNVPNKATALAGEIYYNGQPLPPAQIGRYSSYVMQSDALLSYLTVDETLKFASVLKLKGVSSEKRKAIVEDVINELGLKECRHVLIGGSMRKGISGGQKRRVSIAVELLDNPDLVFLDEPTSGLDSSLAFDVVSVLSNLAVSGRTVVLTIHQPRHQTFALLDELILLSNGRLVYHGDAIRAVDYFAQIGHPCPTTFNPADFVLDLMTPKTDDDDDIEEEGETRVALEQKVIEAMPDLFENDERFVKLRRDMDQIVNAGFQTLPERQTGKHKNAFSIWFSDAMCLTRRAFLNCSRDPLTTIITCVSSTLFALVAGAIFFQLDDPTGPYDCKAIFAILGVTNFVITNLTFSTMSPGARFPEVRPLFNRETANQMYSPSAFLFGKVIAEFLFQEIPPFIYSSVIFWMTGAGSSVSEYFTFVAFGCLAAFCSISFSTFVGCLVPNFPIAIVIIPNIYVLMMFLGGFVLTDDEIPSWISWLKWLSTMRYMFDGLSEEVIGNDPALPNCFYLPTNLSIWANFGITFGLAIAFKFLSVAALTFTNRQVGLQS